MQNCDQDNERPRSKHDELRGLQGKSQEGEPELLEVKGFSISGNAPRISERLGKTDLGFKDPSLLKNALKYAPTHEEMLDFARKISDGFKIFSLINHSELNRQVLMGVSWKGDVKIDFPNEL